MAKPSRFAHLFRAPARASEDDENNTDDHNANSAENEDGEDEGEDDKPKTVRLVALKSPRKPGKPRRRAALPMMMTMIRTARTTKSLKMKAMTIPTKTMRTTKRRPRPAPVSVVAGGNLLRAWGRRKPCARGSAGLHDKPAAEQGHQHSEWIDGVWWPCAGKGICGRGGI